MNITGLAINSSQADLMNQISTKVLDMALDTVTETGEQFAAMLSEIPQQQAPSGIMNAGHIDILV